MKQNYEEEQEEEEVETRRSLIKSPSECDKELNTSLKSWCYKTEDKKTQTEIVNLPRNKNGYIKTLSSSTERTEIGKIPASEPEETHDLG